MANKRNTRVDLRAVKQWADEQIAASGGQMPLDALETAATDVNGEDYSAVLYKLMDTGQLIVRINGTGEGAYRIAFSE